MRKRRTTALKKIIGPHKEPDIAHFFGKNVWKGDLSEMREDKPRRGVKRPRASAGSSRAGR